MSDTSAATADSKPNGHADADDDPTGSAASARAAQDALAKGDAQKLAAADLEIAKAAATSKVAIQAAQAKADKAKADAATATAAKVSAKETADAKLKDDGDGLVAAKKKAAEALDEVNKKKAELDIRAAAYDTAAKALAAAKVESDAAAARLKDAQGAWTLTDAGVTGANTLVATSQTALDTSRADLLVQQTLEATQVAAADAQFAVDKASAEFTEATSKAASVKKRADVLKAAKERND